MKHNILLLVLFLGTVFLLAFNSISDTDVWIHLSHGRLIWETRGFPARELFVFSCAEMPFMYSSWLFGVIVYLVYSAFADGGLVVFQAVLITTSFYVILKDAESPDSNDIAAFVLLPFVVMISQYRFVLRPDMFMILFLAITIFAIHEYMYKGKKYVYLLPLIDLLWANSHSSIPLMLIPYVAFIAGGIIQGYLPEKINAARVVIGFDKIKTMMVLFVISLGASLANPYGYKQYFAGSDLLGSKYVKQEVLELLPPLNFQKYTLLVIAVLLIISCAMNWRRISLFDLLLVVPFLYISCTARRFVFLAAFIGIPIVIRNISTLLSERGAKSLLPQKAIVIILVCWMVLYSSLTIARMTPYSLISSKFGLGFSYDNVPKAAVAYLDRNNIYGRVYNKQIFGQYILWASYPKRTVIMDARFQGGDDLLQKINDAMTSSSAMEELANRYQFEVIIDQTSQVEKTGLHLESYYAFNHPDWALVYWDDTAMVYLKRTKRFEELIRRDEYLRTKPFLSIAGFKRQIGSTPDPDQLMRELERNAVTAHSSLAHLYQGLAYNQYGMFAKAVEQFRQADAYGWIRDYLVAEAIGQQGNHQESIRYYDKSLDVEKTGSGYLGKGTAYYLRGDYSAAITYLAKAIGVDPSLEKAHSLLIDSYNKTGNLADAQRIAAKLELLRAENLKKYYFAEALKLYSNKEYEKAVAAFTRLLAIDRDNSNVLSNLGYCYFDIGEYQLALDCFSKAISLDPSHAIAYYGIAMIHKKRGNKNLAAINYRKYLDLIPTGKFSRIAAQEIATLTK